MSEPSKYGRGGPPIRWLYDLKSPLAPRVQPQQPPATSIDDDPAVCVRVNKSWVPHLVGVLDALNQWDAWDAIEDGWQPRQQIERLINALMLGECVPMIQFRQNPDNPCQLEQSHDGGASWSLAFDYALCKRPGYADVIAITNQIAQYTADFDPADNTTAHPLAPVATWAGAGQTVDEAQAFCFGMALFVATALEAIRESNNNSLLVPQLVLTITGGLGAVAGFLIAISPATGGTSAIAGLSIKALTMIAGGLALGASGGQIGLAVDRALLDAVLSDDAAIADAACWLNASLADVQPTAASLGGLTLGGYAFVNDNAQEIAQAIIEMCATESARAELFVGLLTAIGDAREVLAADPLAWVCPCADPSGNCENYDISWFNSGPTPEGWSGAYGLGSYPEPPRTELSRPTDETWKSPIQSNWNTVFVTRAFDDPCTVMQVNLAGIRGSLNSWFMRVQLRLNGVVVGTFTANGGTSVSDNPTNRTWSVQNVECDEIEYALYTFSRPEITRTGATFA